MRKRFLIGSIGTLVLAITTAMVLLLVYPGHLTAGNADGARVMLRNVDGEPVGVVRLTQEKTSVLVRATVHDLPPGFHGFHVHAVGSCAPDFGAAGGHFNPGGHSHPDHAADMPVLLVNDDGTGEARLKTARFAVADLFDTDGSAIIIHALPDNYANIPSRYAPSGPDEDSLKTGDAGGRIACGVIQQ